MPVRTQSHANGRGLSPPNVEGHRNYFAGSPLAPPPFRGCLDCLRIAPGAMLGRLRRWPHRGSAGDGMDEGLRLNYHLRNTGPISTDGLGDIPPPPYHVRHGQLLYFLCEFDPKPSMASCPRN